MSFIRSLPRQMAPLTRTRLFTTTPYVRKTAAEAAKDTLKSVDRTVSDAAVKGIEKGEQATQTLKSTVGVKSAEAEGKASEMSGDAKGKTSELSGKASEMSGDAKGKTNELSGKASELTGEAKGKAQEVAGQAKGKAEEVKAKM